MIINIKGIDVETREIVSISNAGWRMHGFIVNLTGGRVIEVCQKEAYDMTPQDCGYINSDYRKMREEIEKYWNSDKRDVPVIGINIKIAEDANNDMKRSILNLETEPTKRSIDQINNRYQLTPHQLT